MANVAALCTWLVEGIGCTIPLRNAIIVDQGVIDLEMLGELKKEDIHTLCYNIRKPGGMIANPNTEVAGEPPEIRNPGISVSLIVENRLTLAVYALKHFP
jgi:hypothetical protein